MEETLTYKSGFKKKMQCTIQIMQKSTEANDHYFWIHYYLFFSLLLCHTVSLLLNLILVEVRAVNQIIS